MLTTLPKHPRRHVRMLEPTLRGITLALREAIFAEDLSRRSGLLQALDPRVKIISVLSLLVSISLSRNPWAILVIYLLVLALARLSSIPPILLIRRVWLLMPLFTIPVALPALFMTPGPPLLELPLGLTVTQNGSTAVILLLLRVSASLTSTLLLIYTTTWNTVLSGLTSLRVPGTFALILGMTYRYIYLLLRSAQDMFMSRQSRIVGDLAAGDGRRILAAAAGTLLDKSLKLSGDVYLAMQSRGFHGTWPNLNRFRMRRRDWAAMIGLTLVTAAATWFGQGPL